MRLGQGQGLDVQGRGQGLGLEDPQRQGLSSFVEDNTDEHQI